MEKSLQERNDLEKSSGEKSLHPLMVVGRVEGTLLPITVKAFVSHQRRVHGNRNVFTIKPIVFSNFLLELALPRNI